MLHACLMSASRRPSARLRQQQHWLDSLHTGTEATEASAASQRAGSGGVLWVTEGWVGVEGEYVRLHGADVAVVALLGWVRRPRTPT